MAQQIHYRPEQAKRPHPETQDEMEKFEGRIAEINGLLDQLYESGLMRWVKDFVGAMPDVSMIALESMNTPQGQAGMRNLLVLAKQLGRIDPDQLERTFDAVNKGMDRAGDTADGKHDSSYNPPGITGVFKLLRDEDLWHTLAPVIEGVKAFSAESQRQESSKSDTSKNDTSKNERD